MDEELFRHLVRHFSVIAEVNTEDNSYSVIKMDRFDRDRYQDMFVWVEAFADQVVHKEDKERFLEFFEPFRKHEDIEEKKLFYRRNDESVVCVEIIKMNEPIVLLVAKDVDDYVREYGKQKYEKLLASYDRTLQSLKVLLD